MYGVYIAKGISRDWKTTRDYLGGFNVLTRVLIYGRWESMCQRERLKMLHG